VGVVVGTETKGELAEHLGFNQMSRELALYQLLTRVGSDWTRGIALS